MKEHILHRSIKSFSAAAAMLYINCFNVNGQSPGGVTAGLTAWFKPESGVNITGGNITSWANQATNPNLTTVTPNGAASTLTTNNPAPFNFNPYIQFNNGSLTKEASTTINEIFEINSGSILGVGTEADQLVTNTSNFTTNPCGGNRCCTGIRWNASQFGNTGVNWSTEGSTNAYSANIWGFRASTAGTPQQENTFNGFKNTGSAGTRSNSGTYRFGIGSFIGYFYGSGRISEVVCYNRQLTSTEFVAVESYLAIKYGITLGNTTNPKNYTSSSNNIIWNANTIFQYNIAGIGRDDASALMQKQSKSVHTHSKIAIYNDDAIAGLPSMNEDNSSTINADQSFVIIGNNNKDTTLNKCLLGGRAIGMNRTWKMTKTGTGINTATIAFNSNEFDPNVSCIIISSYTLFNYATSTFYPLATNGTQKFVAIPTDNVYFTFSALPLELNATVQHILCADGSKGSISLNPAGGLPPITYSWNTTPPQSTESINNLNAGSYTVTANQNGLCLFTETYTVEGTSLTPLKIKITDLQNTICAKNNGAFKIIASGGTPQYEYSINNAAWTNNNTYNDLTSGPYHIQVRDHNACTKDTTIILTKKEYNLLVHTIIKDAWCEAGGLGGSVTAVADSGTKPYQYFWPEAPQTSSNVISNIGAGLYKVIVTDNYGCTGTATAEVKEIPCCNVAMPNAFSPNNDGINDRFMPVSNVIIPKYNLVVYNRYGQKIFQSIRFDYGWNGTFNNNGAILDAGTYYYQLRYTCEKSEKEVVLSGDVTLIR
jgi:gliding motility-associated-like protein